MDDLVSSYIYVGGRTGLRRLARGSFSSTVHFWPPALTSSSSGFEVLEVDGEDDSRGGSTSTRLFVFCSSDEDAALTGAARARLCRLDGGNESDFPLPPLPLFAGTDGARLSPGNGGLTGGFFKSSARGSDARSGFRSDGVSATASGTDGVTATGTDSSILSSSSSSSFSSSSCISDVMGIDVSLI